MGLPYGPPPPPPNPELERLRGTVAQYFPVYETRVTPNSLVLLVHADPASLEDRFDRLRQELWPKLYVPQIRHEGGEYLIEIVRRPARSTWGPWINLILLAATCLTTVTAGAIFWLAYRGGATLGAADFAYGALFFGAPVMAILGLHELAHFVVARRHHVEASLPFFLPVPPPFLIFGTFGAFISLREPIPSRKALLDIGAAGPLAGFFVAVPVTLAGLFLSVHSPHLPVSNCGPVVLGVPFGNLLVGESLIYQLLALFIPGPIANLHPLALAGWVGLLVTAMNLLPAGQLDGGHVFRALFGRRSVYFSIAAIILLLFIGIAFGYPGWVIFAFLILFLGIRHPPPLNDLSPLDGRRWAVGALAVALLVGGFVVVPIAQPSGAFTVTDHSWTRGPYAGSGANGTGMVDNLSLTVLDQDFVEYGLAISGRTDQVIASQSGVSVPLSGTALAAFQANTSWRIVLPNGNVSTVAGSGNFSLPRGEYADVGAGASVTFEVVFSNPQQAAVTLELEVAPICSYGASPQVTTYSVN